MNLRTKVKLFLMKFTGSLTTEEYDQMIYILESTHSGRYIFEGFVVTAARRKDTDDIIKATFKENYHIDPIYRGTAATIDGLKMLGNEKAKVIMGIIVEYNKERYASRNEKIRRNRADRRPDPGNDS